MCQTAYYTSTRCKCRWLRVVRPCAPGLGFSTCPVFFNGVAKPQPPYFRTGAAERHDGDGACACCRRPRDTPCPKHDLGGAYDRNDVRMVLGITNGLHWGMGPDKDDVGVEMACCAVM